MIDSLRTTEVKLLFDKGKRIRGTECSLIIGESSGGPFRFAVIPAGAKKAHQRNAIRRKIREAVRGFRKQLPAKKTCVLITSGKILLKTKEEVQKLVEKVLTNNGLLLK